MVMKWLDKKPVSFYPYFTVTPWLQLREKTCINQEEYNLFMGEVGLKDQKLQPYDTEKKRSMKWSTKLFKKLLYSSIHISIVIHRERQNTKKKLDNLVFRVKAMEESSEAHRTGL
jgi:hypothetical protein